jgi:hypothetical protein
MRYTQRSRTTTLESQVIYGPVAILVGARVTRPRPCSARSTRRAQEHTATATATTVA